MCYLITKKFGDTGCVAFQTEHGQHLADFEEKLMRAVGYDKIHGTIWGLMDICLPTPPHQTVIRLMRMGSGSRKEQ